MMIRRLRSAGSVGLLLFCLLLASCGTTTASKISVAPRPTATMFPTPTPTSVPTATPVPVPSIGRPVHLIISALGVNAPVEMVGMASDGNLGTPEKDPWDGVGWYQYGARPGAMGSAVIDGHVDRPGGGPAIFWYLKNLHTGDKVQVLDEQGKSYTFQVTGMADYAPTQAPVQAIFGRQDGRFLNLITCAGTWIPSEHQTTLRLVVYTEMI